MWQTERLRELRDPQSELGHVLARSPGVPTTPSVYPVPAFLKTGGSERRGSGRQWHRARLALTPESEKPRSKPAWL